MRKPVMHKPRSAAVSPAPPALGEGKRGTEGYLGYLLRQAGVAYRTRLERALADDGVTQPQFAVMTMVKAYPGLSNADLARLSLLMPQTVSVIVTNLKRAGLLASRPHAVHGRIQQLALTPHGEKILSRCKAHVTVLERKLAQELSPQQERTVRRWLVKVAVESSAGFD
jgi:DNA-binding MarR family transcriptional regulator